MQSPFKFLDSYSKADKDIFFGRDREIEELYQKIFESKVLLLYGVSGTGKSSLIDCGLGNKIDDSDWLPVAVRRGGHMIESLFSQLISCAVDEDGEGESGGVGEGEKGRTEAQPSSRESKIRVTGEGEKLTPKQFVKLIKSVYLDHFKPIYLVFDQFEELFIFGSQEERKEFIEIVKAITDADVQCKMLFSIREEYLANITEFERVVPEIMENRMRVEKMNRANAMEVISGPCKVNGIELEDGFEEALMNKLVPEGNEVELTYLQVYLDKVFREASGGESSVVSRQSIVKREQVKFKIEILEKLGSVGDLLGSFLEDQIAELDDPESGLAILKSFVSVKGTKRQITHEEVLESCKTLGHEVADDALKELINKFVDLRILRDKDENGRYELRHDSLAAKIFEKITMVEKEVMEVRLFIENAFDNFKKRNKYLSNEDLKYIEPYEERLFLTSELQQFVDKSKYDLDAAKRSFRKIIAISVIGFTLMVAAGIYYYYQENTGKEVLVHAMGAKLQFEYSPELGFRSAMKAYQEDLNNTLSTRILVESFYRLLDKYPHVEEQLYNFSPVETEIRSIHLSHDGQYLYGVLENNEVKIWDLEGNETGSINLESRTIDHLRFSDDNQYLGVLSDSIVRIYSMNDSLHFEVVTSPAYVNDKYLFDFSGREEYAAALISGKELVLYDHKGEIFQELDDAKGSLLAVDISPDKRFIAAGTSDGLVLIWYYNLNTGRYAHYNTLGKQSPKAIRSCQFNSWSNYILTSSDDSIPRLKRLNGDEIWLGRFEAFPGYLSSELENTLMSSTDGMKCDAYFTRGERTLVVCLREDTISRDIIRKRSNMYLLHAEATAFTKTHFPFESLGYDLMIEFDKSDPVRYDFLVAAPDARTVALVVEDSMDIHVLASDHLPILSYRGTCPVYSSDSKYVFSINGNRIQRHIIEATEIIDLVTKDKIFGDLDVKIRDWISY